MYQSPTNNNQLLFILTFVISLYGCYETEVGIPPSDDPLAAHSEIEVEVWERINKYRSSNGLDELRLDSVISDIARRHSQAMADGEVPVGHEGFDERVKAVRNRVGGNSFAENVAAGYPSAETVVEGWVNSSGHRQNIEGDFNLTGVGVAYAEDGTPYYTQIFVLR